MPRRSKPNHGFPSQPLLGISAQRVEQIVALMASGQWGGKITEIGLAREWGLSLDYVQQLAQQASNHLQISLTPDFQAQLRGMLLNATMALTSKLTQYATDEQHHGEHDRYEASNDGGRTWREVTRKSVLDGDHEGSKVRRVPCVPVGGVAGLAQAAFKGWEGVSRLAGVELDPKYLRQSASGGNEAGGEDGPRNEPRKVDVVYTGVEPPKPDEPKG